MLEICLLLVAIMLFYFSLFAFLTFASKKGFGLESFVPSGSGGTISSIIITSSTHITTTISATSLSMLSASVMTEFQADDSQATLTSPESAPSKTTSMFGTSELQSTVSSRSLSSSRCDNNYCKL